MPSDDYDVFKAKAAAAFGSLAKCDEPNLPCIFNVPCSSVPKENVNLSWKLRDDTQEKVLSLGADELLIDAVAIGKPGQCYLGVYMIDKPSSVQNIFYFGSPFMEKYYVSFSLEPYNQDQDSNHLLVGMGPVCKTANLGDVVFNPNYEDY